MMILEGNFLVCITFFIDKNNIYIFLPVRRKFAAYETESENTFWMFINKGTPFFLSCEYLLYHKGEPYWGLDFS